MNDQIQLTLASLKERREAIELAITGLERYIGGQPAATTAIAPSPAPKPAPANGKPLMRRGRTPRAATAALRDSITNLRQAFEYQFNINAGMISAAELCQKVRAALPHINTHNSGITLKRMVAAGQIERLSDGRFIRAVACSQATLDDIKAEIHKPEEE